jgi:hypothetical protein
MRRLRDTRIGQLHLLLRSPEIYANDQRSAPSIATAIFRAFACARAARFPSLFISQLLFLYTISLCSWKRRCRSSAPGHAVIQNASAGKVFVRLIRILFSEPWIVRRESRAMLGGFRDIPSLMKVHRSIDLAFMRQRLLRGFPFLPHHRRIGRYQGYGGHHIVDFKRVLPLPDGTEALGGSLRITRGESVGVVGGNVRQPRCSAHERLSDADVGNGDIGDCLTKKQGGRSGGSWYCISKPR